MSIKSLAVASALLLGTVSVSAYAKPGPAPVWTIETNAVSIQSGLGSILLGGHTYSFTDSAMSPVQLAYYNANPGSNSQASIATFIESSSLFGLSNSTVLSFDGAKDSFTGGAIPAPVKPYDYLAVHIGGGEMLFHWSSKVTTAFNLTGGALSNYRGYASPVAAVPEPETYAMLLAGLGLMGFIARRRKA